MCECEYCIGGTCSFGNIDEDQGTVCGGTKEEMEYCGLKRN